MDLLNVIKEVEDKLDSINADYGSIDELCIYCKAKRYNSFEGIIHSHDCIVYKLRQIIKNGKRDNLSSKDMRKEDIYEQYFSDDEDLQDEKN